MGGPLVESNCPPVNRTVCIGGSSVFRTSPEELAQRLVAAHT